MLRAWLVDLDGTLYHPLPVKLAMAAELLVAGRSAIPTLRAFRRLHEAVRADGAPGDPYREQLSRAARATGQPLEEVTRTVEDWMHDRPGRWLRLFQRRRLIAELRAHRDAGGRAALVSDYPARRKLDALGLANLFDAVVASGEPGGPTRLKPDPEGYLLAAAALGASPAECLVLGDRADADGEAARRAGMAYRQIG